MLAKTLQFVKNHQTDIILAITVILVTLLAFGVGYLVAKEELKQPLRVEYEPTE